MLCGRPLSLNEKDFVVPDKQKALFSQIQSAINEKFRYGNVSEECLDQHSNDFDLQFQHLPQYLLLIDVLQEAFRTEVVHPFGFMQSVAAHLEGKQAASEKAMLGESV